MLPAKTRTLSSPGTGLPEASQPPNPFWRSGSPYAKCLTISAMPACGLEGHEGITGEGGRKRGVVPDQVGCHRACPTRPHLLKTTLAL